MFKKKKKEDEELGEELQEEEKKKKEKVPFTKKRIVKIFVVILSLVSCYNIFRVIDLYGTKNYSGSWNQIQCKKSKKKECKVTVDHNYIDVYRKLHNFFLWSSIVCLILSLFLAYLYRYYTIYLIMMLFSIMFNMLAIVISFG